MGIAESVWQGATAVPSPPVIDTYGRSALLHVYATFSRLTSFRNDTGLLTQKSLDFHSRAAICNIVWFVYFERAIVSSSGSALVFLQNRFLGGG